MFRSAKANILAWVVFWVTSLCFAVLWGSWLCARSFCPRLQAIALSFSWAHLIYHPKFHTLAPFLYVFLFSCFFLGVSIPLFPMLWSGAPVVSICVNSSDSVLPTSHLCLSCFAQCICISLCYCFFVLSDPTLGTHIHTNKCPSPRPPSPSPFLWLIFSISVYLPICLTMSISVSQSPTNFPNAPFANAPFSGFLSFCHPIYGWISRWWKGLLTVVFHKPFHHGLWQKFTGLIWVNPQYGAGGFEPPVYMFNLAATSLKDDRAVSFEFLTSTPSVHEPLIGLSDSCCVAHMILLYLPTHAWAGTLMTKPADERVAATAEYPLAIAKRETSASRSLHAHQGGHARIRRAWEGCRSIFDEKVGTIEWDRLAFPGARNITAQRIWRFGPKFSDFPAIFLRNPPQRSMPTVTGWPKCRTNGKEWRNLVYI